MDSWADKTIEFIYMWLVCLPLSVGDKTKSKILRAACFVIFIPWCLPAILIFGIWVFPFMFISLFLDYLND